MRAVVLVCLALNAVPVLAADLKAGALAFSRGDLSTAVRELRPLAEEGNFLAQYMLGVALANAKPPLLNLGEGRRG